MNDTDEKTERKVNWTLNISLAFMVIASALVLASMGVSGLGKLFALTIIFNIAYSLIARVGKKG